MQTPQQYRSLIEKGLKDLKFPEHPAKLFEPVRYALDCGGKRLRPMLTLAAADALGADPACALDPALAVEIYHNFTLLHDDVMDKADLRRGRPTVRCKWDDTTAILSGDAMLTYASMVLARASHRDPARFVVMNDLFNSTATDVYRGQQYDMDFENRTDVTEQEYIEMIRLKTSVLLGCACAMGVHAAGASQDEADIFYRYGEMLGLAFQLRDDYLDTYGDVELFGKEVGRDIINDKKTWLSVTAINDPRSSEIVGLFGHELSASEKVRRVRALYDRAELPERIRTLINDYSGQALDSLAQLDLDPEAVDFFRRLTVQLCARVV